MIIFQNHILDRQKCLFNYTNTTPRKRAGVTIVSHNKCIIREKLNILKTRTICPYAATFLDIYPISPPIYIYIYINTYIHIYLHVLLFNFLTTFSFRMLCLKKPYNMDFLKEFKTKIFIF